MPTHADDSMRFAELFRRARRNAPQRCTLADVADLTHLSVSYVSDVEHGRRNPPDTHLITLVCERLFKTDPTPMLRAAALERGAVKLRATSPEKVQLLAGLARRLEHISPEDVARIRKILEGED